MARKRNIIRSLWCDTEGTVLLEATLLLPVLAVLFFGVFEFSWYFYNQQLVESGVRDAARYLARGPYTSVASFVDEGTSPCDDAANVAAAKEIAVTGTSDGSRGPRVKGWATKYVTISCPKIDNTGNPYDGPNPFYLVKVGTVFPDPILGFIGFLGLGTPNLSAYHEERAFGSG